MNLSEYERIKVFLYTLFSSWNRAFCIITKIFTHQWQKVRERKYPQYYHMICIAFSDYLKFKFINSANIQTRRKKKTIGANARHIIPVGVETLKPLKIASVMEMIWGRKFNIFSFFFLFNSSSLICWSFSSFHSRPSSILVFCHHVVFLLPILDTFYSIQW